MQLSSTNMCAHCLSPQAYFQRVLACRTPRVAQILSFCAAIGCIIMVAPAIVIGAVAKSTGTHRHRLLATSNVLCASMICPVSVVQTCKVLTPLFSANKGNIRAKSIRSAT